MKKSALFLIFAMSSSGSLVFTDSVSATESKALVPVVFAHGMFVSAPDYERLADVRKLFKKNGFDFLVARTPLDGGVEDRAKILQTEIDRLVPSGPLHVIAQSIGGLDSRFAISRLGLGARVLSLTTISTPHHGTPVADYAASLMDPHIGKGDTADKVLRWFQGSVDSAQNLTTRFLTEKFNIEVPNDARVKYFSMGFRIAGKPIFESMVPLLWWGHKIAVDQGFPDSDGLVTPESSKWGEYLGTFDGDHAAESLPYLYKAKLIYMDSYKLIIKKLKAEF